MKKTESTKRPFIGIFFDCCKVYARIYRNAKGDSYNGACPRCFRRIRAAIGEGGVDQRFFRAK